ncbi:MAG: adenylate/guanylate cyclase domain-containing protein, partial [Planctomycetota bacterium]
DPHKLLDKSLEKLFEVFPQADRGIVVLYGPDGSEPSQLSAEKEQGATLDRRKGAITKIRHRNPPKSGDNEIKLSRTLMKKVRTERQAFVFDDSSGGGAGMSIAKFEIKSLMCAPLITEKDDIGFIQIESKNLMQPFKAADLDILSAVAGQIAVVIRNAELALSAAAAAAQRENLSRFLSPQLVEEVLNEKQSIELGGVEKKGTIFFSDIVGFTKIASKMKPHHVVALLNRYFTVMQNIIFKRGGSIDKCAGDNIMAHWGMLGNLPYCAESGVTSSVEMQIALFTFNRTEMLRPKEEGFTPVILGHGIGLNTGMVCAGNIGSERKIEFTVIGDAVNLSARIEAMAGREQTFIGEPTWEDVKTRSFAFRMPNCPAKNVAHLLPVFSVRAIIPPPEKGVTEDPATWTVADMLLCLPCRIVLESGEKVNAVVVSLVPASVPGEAQLELHVERYVKHGQAVKFEWDLPEKLSFPGFDAMVESSFPLSGDSTFNPTASMIARGRTSLIVGKMEPGMMVLKTKNMPPEVAAIGPGVLMPSDIKSHEDIIRA